MLSNSLVIRFSGSLSAIGLVQLERPQERADSGLYVVPHFEI